MSFKDTSVRGTVTHKKCSKKIPDVLGSDNFKVRRRTFPEGVTSPYATFMTVEIMLGDFIKLVERIETLEGELELIDPIRRVRRVATCLACEQDYGVLSMVPVKNKGYVCTRCLDVK